MLIFFIPQSALLRKPYNSLLCRSSEYTRQLAALSSACGHAYACIRGNPNGIITNHQFMRITEYKRMLPDLPCLYIADFRKKVMGWDAWATFEALEPPPSKKPHLPPTMETLALRNTPWRARKDSMGVYHPCSCCPDCAQEAVKQGSATVGLKSKTHAVLIALKRAR